MYVPLQPLGKLGYEMLIETYEQQMFPFAHLEDDAHLATPHI